MREVEIFGAHHKSLYGWLLMAGIESPEIFTAPFLPHRHRPVGLDRVKGMFANLLILLIFPMMFGSRSPLVPPPLPLFPAALVQSVEQAVFASHKKREAGGAFAPPIVMESTCFT